MRQSSSVVSWCFSFLCAMAIGIFATSPTRAQEAAQDESKINPTAADRAAAEEATIIYRHARPANTPAASKLKQKDIITKRQSATERAGANTNTSTSTADNDQLRYPADLSYLGGQVVTTAESHAIYLLPKSGSCNKIAPCWGNPEGFLSDLSGSDFIHLVDQYTGMAVSHRYTLGAHATIHYTPSKTPLVDADIQGYVHAVASKTGQSGYGHIYHVFLPPGQDVCFTKTDGICYSPDVGDTFVFCAYHSSMTFTNDQLHVLYTVQPFQNVPGCQVRPGTHNGQLVDSADNSLSHETIETITDPDGDAWFNFTAVVLAGQEIADECSFFVISPKGDVFGDPSTITMNRRIYAVQPEYSNMDHACATSP